MISDGRHIDEYGTKTWYLSEKLHRIGGPSVEYINGSKCYHVDGKLHRLDGPAVEYAWGAKYWYVDDQAIDCETQEEFERMMRLKAFW